MKTSKTKLYLIAVLMLFISFGIISSANAWIFVPNYGSTGTQTFSYEFDSDFSGTVGFVVSDQGDSIGDSRLLLNLWSGVVTLSTEYDLDDTSAFENSRGASGTTGSIFEVPISFDAGSIFSFDWEFNTDDYSDGYWGFNDFSLVYLEDASGATVYSEGLGQIAPVPEPATMLLFGSGLLGLAGLKRKFKK
jgi:hypothetical protein